ncbi:MAG: 60S ribosomal protein L28 [Promethearchaeota archaeon]
MESSQLIPTWRYLANGQCAYKSAATSPKKRCNHLFTVTGTCRYIDCPLVQPEFFSFQQQENSVYLIKKDPKAPPASTWGFTELPEDREKAKKVVEKEIKSLNEKLKPAVWRRFEQQFNAAELIRASQELTEEEDEELDEEL